MKTALLTALLTSNLALAAAPPAARMPRGELSDEDRADRREERERRVRMMFVVGLAEALGLTEAEALRLSDKVKGQEEKRRPVREQMLEAMRTVKAAADGDPAALPQVDQAVQRVLDGRQQMAALDKELFAVLSKDLSPQKRAQLAVFLAKFTQEFRGKGGKGRHQRQRF